jgi:hypothetical protein
MSHCHRCKRKVGRCLCGVVLFLSAEGFNSETPNEIIGERAVIRGLETQPPENYHQHTDSGGSWVVQQAPVVRQATSSGGFGPAPRPPLQPEVYASIVQQWHDAALEANWGTQRTLRGRR